MNENESPEPGPDGAEPPDLWLVDRLMSGDVMSGDDRPGGTPDRERVRMQRVIDALRAPGTPAELAGRAAALDAFDELPLIERKPLRTIVVGSRAAIVAGVAVLAAATGAAAYTGSLPGPLQQAAHSTIGAPAADDDQDASDGDQGEPTESSTEDPSESPTGAPTGAPTQAVGPDATGPAAFGLCTAWSHGGLSTTSVAYRNLAAAAGGADGITAYCATVTKANATKSHGSPTSHPGHGSPTSHSGHGSPTSHPGKTDHPHGSPTTHPGH